MLRIENENTLIIENMYEINEDELRSIKGGYDITKIVLPDTLQKINSGAFSDFMFLEDINFPDSLRSIGKEAFSSCVSLEHVKLNEGLITIDEDAFTGCNLNSLYIPSTVSYIYPCIGLNDILKEITVSKDNETYSDMGCNIIYNKEEDTLVLGCSTSIIPENTKILDENCFRGTNIKKIVIPKDIDCICDNAFFMANIEEMIIKCQLDVIEEYAFLGSNIKNIYVTNIDKDSKFYQQYKDKIHIRKLDDLISEGMSINDINKIFKNNGYER